MCYFVYMSLADITRLVSMLMNGIRSDAPIDPCQHADFFTDLCAAHGWDFSHDSTEGYVFNKDAEIICYVQWEEDGVSFEQHTYHEDTLHVIRLALNTLQAMEEETAAAETELMEEESVTEEKTQPSMSKDDTTFDDDWI
jgi:hypothetical protein